MKKLLLLAIMLVGCVHTLPVCQRTEVVVPDEWSHPCRAADESNTTTGELDLPDPTDLDAGR